MGSPLRKSLEFSSTPSKKSTQASRVLVFPPQIEWRNAYLHRLHPRARPPTGGGVRSCPTVAVHCGRLVQRHGVSSGTSSLAWSVALHPTNRDPLPALRGGPLLSSLPPLQTALLWPYLTDERS